MVTDSRIFVSFDYGTMGLGINVLGEPQFTVGASYSTLSNLDVMLDYVVNNLATRWCWKFYSYRVTFIVRCNILIEQNFVILLVLEL